MYTVEWCSETGVLQERRFESLEDARLEAADLNDKYVYVRIRDANGNTIEA